MKKTLFFKSLWSGTHGKSMDLLYDEWMLLILSRMLWLMKYTKTVLRRQKLRSPGAEDHLLEVISHYGIMYHVPPTRKYLVPRYSMMCLSLLSFLFYLRKKWFESDQHI
jgi:hypothetical protein